MCHKSAKHFLFLSTLLLPGLRAFAQNSNKENLPYTRYGLGSVVSGTNVQLRGMGSISSAFSNPFVSNSDNPASYAFLLRTSYEAGGTASMTTVYSNDKSYGTGNATLSYINIGIPLAPLVKNFALNIGVKPQTKVYYKVQADSVLSSPALGKTSYLYSGDGGLNYAFLGAAYRIKGFSIGANFGYSFGTIRNSSVMQHDDTAHALSSEFTQYTKIGGIYWESGAMYETPLNAKTRLRLGATFKLNQNLNAWRDEYNVNFRNLNGSIDQDTTYHSSTVTGKIVMPMSYSLGAMLAGTDRWSAGIDFSMTQWNQYRNYGMTDSVADHSMKIGIGGEITPNPQARRNYLQRISYRAGFFYGNDYVYLRNTPINFYAFTLGASLPLKSDRLTWGKLHTALEVGRRGTETNGLIRENYVKFSLGLTLNDTWFIPRKYE